VITRLRHLIFDHVLLKLAALVIAVLMWYGVAREPITEITLRVPIEFARTPRDLDYSSEAAIPQAQLRLRGPASVLRELPQENVHVVLDLKGATAGEHTYDISADQVRVPHNVEVLQVTPSRLHMVLERSRTQEALVMPRLTGSPMPGYRVASITAQPATVTISGPEHHVNATEGALTDPVDITGIDGEQTFETRAYLSDPLVHLLGSNTIRVTVTAEKAPSKDKSASKAGAR
jgi:YbbR domain-containing protein